MAPRVVAHGRHSECERRRAALHRNRIEGYEPERRLIFREAQLYKTPRAADQTTDSVEVLLESPRIGAILAAHIGDRDLLTDLQLETSYHFPLQSRPYDSIPLPALGRAIATTPLLVDAQSRKDLLSG